MAFKPTVIFDALANILTKKSLKVFDQHVNDEQLFKTYSNFMILRYLTMSQSEDVRNVVLDNYETLEKMQPKAQYRWLLNKVPQQRNSWIKYIK